MEQTTQQNIQKPTLPIKTKITAWGMAVIGGVIIISGLLGAWVSRNVYGGGAIPFSLFIIIITCPFGLLVFFLPGVFLLKRKKWAWWFSVVMLFISILTPYSAPDLLISLLPSPSIYLNLINRIIPLLLFILLLLDRKNFWKIVT
jgi:hypothetical protein